MSYSCLDALGRVPTTDVAALCARDAVGLASFRARGAVAGLHAWDVTGCAIIVGLGLACAITSLRLAALIAVAARLVLSRRGGVVRDPRRARMRSVVERHRHGKP